MPPAADPALHVAPAEPHPIKRSLWQRWMDWSGSFFVLSILLHVLLLGGATVLVVQVVQARKEKLKFTAPPPSAAGAVEHKVKPSKKMEAAVPSVSKRITSTAANASIALPAMNMSASTGPDVMASVMSGMGSGGLGAGAGGLASMPLTGLTAFGFKGGNKGGLVGHFYDLKQKMSGQGGKEIVAGAFSNHFAVLEEFFTKGWDQNVLKRYFEAKDTVLACQIFMPAMGSLEAPKAFGVDKEIQGMNWVVHYKGSVTAPRSGMFRFVGRADDMMYVRFGGQDVFADCYPQNPTAGMSQKLFPHCFHADPAENIGLPKGIWFQVEKGKRYPMEVIVSEAFGGISAYLLMIEEKNPAKPYPKRKCNPQYNAYPVFQTMKGIPIPPYQESKMGTDPSLEKSPEVAPDPVIFPCQ